jgi:hypothetical protein
MDMLATADDRNRVREILIQIDEGMYIWVTAADGKR